MLNGFPTVQTCFKLILLQFIVIGKLLIITFITLRWYWVVKELNSSSIQMARLFLGVQCYKNPPCCPWKLVNYNYCTDNVCLRSEYLLTIHLHLFIVILLGTMLQLNATLFTTF